MLTWSILLYAFSAFFAAFSTSPEMLLVLRTTTFVGVCIEFVAAVAWLLYTPYELAMHERWLCSGECNIRVDLLLLRREAYRIDVPKAIDAALANGVIIELNAHPSRLDLDWRHWRKAAERGLLCAINPDAHESSALTHVRAGVNVAHFHPLRISNLGRLNNRDHRKLAVIDGRIGYVGGHCIADTWLGNAEDKQHWRDTTLRITGPVVARLQACFAENWTEETGEIPACEKYFQKLVLAGVAAAHIAYTSPNGSISSLQILYYVAIKAARHEILIQNPYLLPDREAIAALEDAVKRGVDVKIMVPSDDATDSPVVQHASHHHFGALLERGVKIWEYERTLLHQKVIVIDGIWSSVGSTNFDDRSFDLNDEVNIGVFDPAVAAQLEAAFEQDPKFARRVTAQSWQNRGWRHKLVDGLAYLGRSQL